MRSTVFEASTVFMLERTMWPFSAASRRISSVSGRDFPHHDDAGRLPQRGSQRQGKIGRIAVQFALVYRRSLVLVQKFDRIFHRQDVIAIFAVDRVDQRGQRRGLPDPCLPSPE